jgi:general secretion pathway protein A
MAIASAALLLPRFLSTQVTAAPAPVAATAAAPVPATKPAPPPTLDRLLAQYDAETDPDDAFNKLFALWGMRYVVGGTDPCTQALQAGLECLTQRGSLAQLRLFNRPAVLNVVGADGRSHQMVLAGLDEEHAQLDLGGAQRQIGIGDLSSSWFGDYVLLWRPAAGGSGPMALGARSARVKWLRDSLRRVNGMPAEETASDRFDASLVTLVEDFQRKNRLSVDGIAGVQTQVALDAALNDATTPFLRNATGG